MHPKRFMHLPRQYMCIYMLHIWNSLYRCSSFLEANQLLLHSERCVRTIQRVCHFIKAVIRLTWAITHLKKKKCTRCASNKAVWGSGCVCERWWRIRQVRARKCVKVSDGEKRWIFSYFGNEWVKRHGIQSRRLHYTVEDKEKKGKDMRWDSASLLNCFVTLKA